MTAPLTSPATLRARIAVIDVMRGLVMLIMLFDHVRETVFLHHQVSDPMDAAHVDPALFFTRLAAHVCAPMFVFLGRAILHLSRPKLGHNHSITLAPGNQANSRRKNTLARAGKTT